MQTIFLLSFAAFVAAVCAFDQPQPAVPAPNDKAAVEKSLQEQKQANLKFEQTQHQKEEEEAKKRAVEQTRLLLEKDQQAKEARVKQARLDREKFHNEDTQARKLQERHNFLLAQAKADELAFRQAHPKDKKPF